MGIIGALRAFLWEFFGLEHCMFCVYYRERKRTIVGWEEYTIYICLLIALGLVCFLMSFQLE
jgi:hypothetical protein